jgi:MFS family permease
MPTRKGSTRTTSAQRGSDGQPGEGRLGAICGPLLGGALLTAGIAYPWGFYVFAIVGVLGAAAAWIVPRQTPQQHRATDALPVAIDLTHKGGRAV